MSDSVDSQTLSRMMVALDWAYDKAVNGIPTFARAEDLAEDYLSKTSSSEQAINDLILWQVGKASVAGFLSGVGGIITLTVAVPINFLSVLWIQLRMIAAIAYIRGFDIRSDQVKTLVVTCLAGSSASEILRDTGIIVSSKFTQQAITKISKTPLTRINQTVGFRFLAKSGSTAAVNLSKIVPFIGGLVGGSIDAAVTHTMGAAAKSVFQNGIPGSPSEVAR
jgi:uncharacterized protein (DUF697 family)